jgi:hypothetical protein
LHNLGAGADMAIGKLDVHRHANNNAGGRA